MKNILATQKDLNDAIAPLDTRPDTIEANPVRTATDCNGAVLVENVNLAQCADIPSGGPPAPKKVPQ